jgi:formate dehydrogenase maturation protein FdhE
LSAGGPGPGVWARRRARALALAEQAPHAREILETYSELLALQEATAVQVPEGWGADADATELEPLFRTFLDGACGVGTRAMQEQGQALLEAPAVARAAALVEAAGGEAQVHARAFLEAVATELARRGEGPLRLGPASDVDAVEGHAQRCPACGDLALVGVLWDEPGAMGARALICGSCATEWRAPRVACVACGEADSGSLHVHVAESLPHLRVDACASCRRYLKVVDLRKRGDAVPVVEEVASIELDLWAHEAGLRKVRANVLGL